jgi:hypothetical protein
MFPGLEITGVGTVGLPLTDLQAKEIIKVSSLAPFGRKDQTILDTTVRNTWQINPDQVQIKNPQ